MKPKYRMKELLIGFGISLAVYVGISLLLGLFIVYQEAFLLGFFYGGVLYVVIGIWIVLILNRKIEERVHGILLSFAFVFLIAFSACASSLF